MKTLLQSIYDKLVQLDKVNSQADFGEKLGYKSEGYISTLLKSNDELPPKMQKKLHEVFGISKQWIASNGKEGTMLPDDEGDEDLLKEIKISENKETIFFGKQVYRRLNADEYSQAFKDWKGVPMYNVPVTASFVETYRDENVFHPQYYLHDPRFKDCNFGAIITGDSMHSEIRHGDMVVCQEVIDKSFIVFGDIYYVVSNNGLETCKYVNADPDNRENLLLVARNEKISPSPIPRKMIHKLFKVRGVLRGY